MDPAIEPMFDWRAECLKVDAHARRSDQLIDLLCTTLGRAVAHYEALLEDARKAVSVERHNLAICEHQLGEARATAEALAGRIVEMQHAGPDRTEPAAPAPAPDVSGVAPRHEAGAGGERQGGVDHRPGPAADPAGDVRARAARPPGADDPDG